LADRHREIRRLAVKLLDEAFERLTEERVLPRSRYEPWIHVGYEFEGWIMHGLPSYGQFVTALESSFPSRFASGSRAEDFAGIYPDALVTSAVARLTRTQQPYDARQPAALDVVRAFIRYVSSVSLPIAAIYVVAGIETPADGVSAGGLRVIPAKRGSGDPLRTIEMTIPGAGFELSDAFLSRAGLPTSVMIASTDHPLVEPGARHEAFERGHAVVTGRLDGLVSAIRLASNATVHVLGSAWGQPGPFQLYRARVRPVQFDWMADVRRVITLDAPLISRLNRLHRLWLISVTSVDKVVPTLSIAVQRFNRSFGEEHWQERLVDLAVALEAALGQEDGSTEIQLRLQTRAAALLADGADDAGRIFDDLGVMYDLRSRVVHGSSQSSEKLRRRIEKVPATAPGRMPGIKTELLIDRCRDLARRAILARLFLSQGQDPAWPLSNSKNLDRRLADDSERRRLRRLWRKGLKGIGLSQAASPAETPVVFGASPEPTG
jgi:Apea-like HEPN